MPDLKSNESARPRLPDATLRKAVRNLLGMTGVKDAADARMLMDVLGLDPAIAKDET